MLVLTALVSCSAEQESHHSPADLASDSERAAATADTADEGADSKSEARDSELGVWPEEGLWLDRALLVDGEGGREGGLLLSGGEILEVLPPGEPGPAGPGWERRDLDGAVVMPGLVDSHVHLFHSGATRWVGSTLESNLRAQLYWGVLGVQDLGSPEALLELPGLLDSGHILGPRMRASGPFLTASGSHPCEESYDRALCVFVDGDGAEQAEQLLRAGSQVLKIALADQAFFPPATPRLDRGDLGAILEASGEVDVVAHVGSVQDALDASSAGVQALAHPPFGDRLQEDQLLDSAWPPVYSSHSAFALLPSLLSGADLSGSDWEATSPAVLEAWREIQRHPEWLYPGWAEASAVWAEQLSENLRLLREHGVQVLPGSDAGYYFVPHGLALHLELEQLVQIGWTEQEVIWAATAGASEALGWSDRGWLAPGYRADLVVLEASPLESISNTQGIRAVLLDGVWRDRSELQELSLFRGSPSSAEGTFCLEDAACSSELICDQIDHRCVSRCELPHAIDNSCGELASCQPSDGLVSLEGACHQADVCDWRSQDCSPESYEETCVPSDRDTSTCLPSGERGAGERCSLYDPVEACETGLLCSWLDGDRCLPLCDPEEEESCAEGRCVAYAPGGSSWFGLCR